MIDPLESGTNQSDRPVPSSFVLNADLALRLCAQAWRWPDSTSTDPSAWVGLASEWRDRLLELGEDSVLPGPEAALELLRRSHRLQRRAELDRVHPSWWMRALQDESPAIRRVIAAQGPPRIRGAAQAALRLDPEGPHVGQVRSQEAIGWVLALWTERLVGGEPVGVNDPPVIAALASFPAPQLYRLCHAAGLAKAALAADPQVPGAGVAVEQERDLQFREQLLRRLGLDQAEAQVWARRDLSRARRPEETSPRRFLASVGLKTIARLLGRCEPFRTRWALQHVPYPVAKRIRSIMASTPDDGLQAHFEDVVLHAAWQRLHGESRLALAHPDGPPRTDHAA